MLTYALIWLQVVSVDGQQTHQVHVTDFYASQEKCQVVSEALNDASMITKRDSKGNPVISETHLCAPVSPDMLKSGMQMIGETNDQR